MIYSRDSTVCSFDSNDVALLYGTVESHMGVRQGDPLGPLSFQLGNHHPPPGHWGTVQGLIGDPSLL
jgi:hypothetical protein